jgi:hypothetical protein
MSLRLHGPKVTEREAYAGLVIRLVGSHARWTNELYWKTIRKRQAFLFLTSTPVNVPSSGAMRLSVDEHVHDDERRPAVYQGRLSRSEFHEGQVPLKARGSCSCCSRKKRHKSTLAAKRNRAKIARAPRGHLWDLQQAHGRVCGGRGWGVGNLRAGTPHATSKGTGTSFLQQAGQTSVKGRLAAEAGGAGSGASETPWCAGRDGRGCCHTARAPSRCAQRWSRQVLVRQRFSVPSDSRGEAARCSEAWQSVTRS